MELHLVEELRSKTRKAFCPKERGLLSSPDVISHAHICMYMNEWFKKKKKAFPEQLSSCQDIFCHKWHPDDEWIIKMWWGTTKNVWLPWNELFPGAFKASAADESHIQWDVIAPGKQHPLDLPYLLLWNSLQFLPINNSGKWLWPLQAANYFSAVSPHH